MKVVKTFEAFILECGKGGKDKEECKDEKCPKCKKEECDCDDEEKEEKE
jgi:hypothetical protein